MNITGRSAELVGRGGPRPEDDREVSLAAQAPMKLLFIGWFVICPSVVFALAAHREPESYVKPFTVFALSMGAVFIGIRRAVRIFEEKTIASRVEANRDLRLRIGANAIDVTIATGSSQLKTKAFER